MVTHNGELQLNKSQEKSLEIHQNNEELTAVHAPVQMQASAQTREQVQPGNLYELSEEQLERLELTREEEEELEQIAGKRPDFQQLTPKQEKSMEKWHKNRYRKYTEQRQRAERYDSMRSDYIALARARRQIDGENERAISPELSADEKAKAIDERLNSEMKPSEQLSREDRAARDELKSISDHAYNLSMSMGDSANADVRKYCSSDLAPQHIQANAYLRARGKVLLGHPELAGNEEAITDEIVKIYKELFWRMNEWFRSDKYDLSRMPIHITFPELHEWHKTYGHREMSESELREEVASHKSVAQNVTKALNAAVIPRDTVLTHGVGMVMLKAFGIDTPSWLPNDVERLADRINSNIQGSVYREEGGSSMSAYSKNGAFENSDVQVVILAHKGTRGVLRDNHDAGSSDDVNSVMLAPGQSFRIIKAEAKRTDEGEPKAIRLYVETIPSSDAGIQA